MPECGMPAPLVTTPTVAHMTLESPSDKAITSLYRAALGPVNTEREACYFTCGPRGESVEFLHAFFINDAGIQWIAAHPAEEFEITSCLGEM